MSKRGQIPYAFEPTQHRHAAFFEHVARLAGSSRVTWLPPRPHDAFKLNPIYRLLGLDDYEPLTLRRQAEYFHYFLHGEVSDPGGDYFFGAILRHFDQPARLVRPWLGQVAARRRLLDLAAGRYFVALRRSPLGDLAGEFVERAGLVELPSPDPTFRLYENPDALPRAFVTYRTRLAPRSANRLLRRLARVDFDPLALGYVEGTDPPGREPDAPERGHGARIVRDEETLVEIEARLEAPGLVVLADSFYRGWRATVDGEPAPILPTNHLFRGVRAPAGTHRVRFEYRPWSLPAGVAASLAGVAVWIGLCVHARRQPPVTAR